MFKGAVPTLVALIVPAWVMFKLFGDPDELGMVGFSFWVLGGLVIALLVLWVIDLLYRE